MGKSISVIGGDMRQAILADMLKSDGYDICKCGLENQDSVLQKSLSEAVSSDILILPLPVSHDNTLLNAPLSSEKIYISDILSNASKDSIVLGGNFTDYLKGELAISGIQYADYFQREELIVQNAIPTAEGAIELAMSELPITLHNSNALILGFGRIGKVLAKMLGGIGANVTVAARKCETLSWIHTLGYNGINMCQLYDCISNYDVIFNTVPSLILDKQLLRNVNKKTLVIDLASKPGGVGVGLDKKNPNGTFG